MHGWQLARRSSRKFRTALHLVFYAVLASSPPAFAGSDTTYSLRVFPGVNPTMSAAQVANIALTHLARPIQSVAIDPQTGQIGAVPAPPRILAISAVAGADLDSADPHLSAHPEYGTLWLVVAEGRFIGLDRPYGAPPIVGSRGYYLIDDSTGRIIGWGIYPRNQ